MNVKEGRSSGAGLALGSSRVLQSKLLTIEGDLFGAILTLLTDGEIYRQIRNKEQYHSKLMRI